MRKETLPAYCLNCGKYLGEVSGTLYDLLQINSLCYDCLGKTFPTLPKFKFVGDKKDLVITHD